MMDGTIIEAPKVEHDEETTMQENNMKTESVAGCTSAEAAPVIDEEAKKIVRDSKAKRKDEKTVQQLLKSLDNLKTPKEKLAAMCKKYSELLHENRQLQTVVKQSEKNINMMHRENEKFRHEKSIAVLTKMRMEQLCRELQKLNKAQQEETALKLRVEEEKRKETCFTFQNAFAEMNTLTHQNNEKSAKMREENLEMREKIKSVREGIELTEAQLDKVRQQSKLELELAEKKCLKATLELTAEKEALMSEKQQLLMKLAHCHLRMLEQERTETLLKKQISTYEERFEELKQDTKRTTELLKTFRPESREINKKMLKLEKETALWKQRWEKTNASVIQMTEIKEKRDAEMLTLTNKLSTLQELCKAFQRERASLIAQLKEKNDGAQIDRKARADENRKAMKQVDNIAKDCEKIKDNLTKLEGSFSEAVREAFRASVCDEESNETLKESKKISKKVKNSARKKHEKKHEDEKIEEPREAEKLVDDDTSDAGAIEARVEKIPVARESLATKPANATDVPKSIEENHVSSGIRDNEEETSESDESKTLPNNDKPEVEQSADENPRTIVENLSAAIERIENSRKPLDPPEITGNDSSKMETIEETSVKSQPIADGSRKMEQRVVDVRSNDEERSMVAEVRKIDVSISDNADIISKIDHLRASEKIESAIDMWNVKSQPIADESTTTSPMEERSMKPEVTEMDGSTRDDAEIVSKIDDLGRATDEIEAAVDEPKDPTLGIKDNAIEA